MKPKFVNADMFKQYTGMDLSERLRSNDNVSDATDIFLYRIEKRLMAWIDKNTFRVVSWDRLTKFQLENLQCAILEQAQYVWKNGDIALDSGYDQDGRGIVADIHNLQEIVVCQPCIDLLANCGLFNLKITNRKRFMNGDAFGILGTGERTIVPPQPAPEPVGPTSSVAGTNYSWTEAEWED